MRELTRMRVHIQQDRNRVINRIGRLLETANIKLGSVASSIAGKSGRAILKRLAEGPQQPEELARLALGAWRDSYHWPLVCLRWGHLPAMHETLPSGDPGFFSALACDGGNEGPAEEQV